MKKRRQAWTQNWPYRCRDGGASPPSPSFASHLRFFVIAKLPPQSVQATLERLGVTVIEKLRVAVMGRLDAPGVLDRAPILFGTRRHFTRVGGNAVAVGAIETIEFFDQIQVGLSLIHI